MLSPRPWEMIRNFHSTVWNPCLLILPDHFWCESGPPQFSTTLGTWVSWLVSEACTSRGPTVPRVGVPCHARRLCW